jgi:hypothetical protein
MEIRERRQWTFASLLTLPPFSVPTTFKLYFAHFKGLSLIKSLFCRYVANLWKTPKWMKVYVAERGKPASGSTSWMKAYVADTKWKYLMNESLRCRYVANLQVEDPHEWKIVLHICGKPANGRPPWMNACVSDTWQTCKWKTPMNESLCCRYMAP